MKMSVPLEKFYLYEPLFTADPLLVFQHPQDELEKDFPSELLQKILANGEGVLETTGFVPQLEILNHWTLMTVEITTVVYAHVVTFSINCIIL